jgi:hypothetical protein
MDYITTFSLFIVCMDTTICTTYYSMIVHVPKVSHNGDGATDIWSVVTSSLEKVVEATVIL